MNKQDVLDIFSSVETKPTSFHHLCYGGSSIPILDKWTLEPILACPEAGEGSWMTPACKNCDGKHVCEEMELNDYARQYNSGARNMRDAIIAALAKESK